MENKNRDAAISELKRRLDLPEPKEPILELEGRTMLAGLVAAAVLVGVVFAGVDSTLAVASPSPPPSVVHVIATHPAAIDLAIAGRVVDGTGLLLADGTP